MFGRHRPSLDLLSKCGLPLWIVTLDPRSPHSEGLDVFIGEDYLRGRQDRSQREREITQRMMDLTPRPFTGTLTYFCRLRIHARSCTERQRGCRQRGPIISQIAVMTNSRIKEEREGFKGRARKRGTLSTSDFVGGSHECAALVTTLTRHT